MRLFTVDRGDILEEGKILTLTDSDPWDNIRPYTAATDLYSSGDLQRHVLSLFPDGLSHHGWAYMKAIHTRMQGPNLLIDYSYLLEMNIEYVRKAYYPNAPSRMQSVFACETIDAAREFRKLCGPLCAEKNIYAIESNNALRADMKLLLLGKRNAAGSFLAHKYWKGGSGTEPFWEFIVELPAKVIRKVG